MADRKVGEITVPTEPVSRATKITGFTFKSYDKNAGVLQFNIENQDGSPTDLIDATVRLFMYIYQGEEKKEFPIFDNQIITESYMQGIVKYRIPDMLLSYEGKVDANVYIDFPDGSHTDNLAFTFTIEKSIIDDNVQLNGEYYFKDFQQLLDGVKQEATDAVNVALTNIDTVSQNVTSAQNNLKAVEDKMNQTNQQIGDLGKLKKMYSNSIDFGDYDYSGRPNLFLNLDFSKLSRNAS
ncbi:BppU family phage baseplate upper protein, partial [Escherichia coli]|uniref:BppU family phage baseplate upper protein n=3 Tax=Bacteria TaxID=2 RepID=UPI00115A5C1B